MQEYQPIYLSPQMVILPRDLAEAALKALYGPSTEDDAYNSVFKVEPYSRSEEPE